MIRFFRLIRAGTWTRAFALSMGAVGGLIALEGGAWLLGDGKLFAPPAVRTSILDVAWCETRRIAVATFWTGRAERCDRFESLAAVIEPDSPLAQPNNVWPELKPRRLALAGPQGRLAIACEDGTLHVLQTISADTRRTLIGRHPEGEPEALLCTADGAILISKGPDYLCAWDIAAERLLWPAAARTIQCVAVHPQQAMLFCGRSDGFVDQRDARTGRLLRDVSAPRGPIAALAVLPDGERAASVMLSDEVSVWRLDTGEALWSASLLAAAPRSLSVSPDGRWLAVGTLSEGRWKAMCFEVATGRRQELAASFSNAIHGTLFTQDGHVFGWGADGSVRLCSRLSLSEVRRWLPGKAATSL